MCDITSLYLDFHHGYIDECKIRSALNKEVKRSTFDSISVKIRSTFDFFFKSIYDLYRD